MKNKPEELKTHTKSGFIREAVEEYIKKFNIGFIMKFEKEGTIITFYIRKMK